MRTATKSVNLIIQREKKQEQKKTNLQVPNTFLYIYLPLFCITTCHCFARLNRKICQLHIILMEQCCTCSPKILLLVFLYTFIFLTAAHFHHSLPLLFLITRFSSFSVIHVSVGIKNNIEKDVVFFSLNVRVAMRFPAEKNSSCIWVAIPVD